MPQGKPREPSKEQHWRQLLERWQDSGLSVRVFCRRHRLAEPTFYAWRRTLAQLPSPALPPTNPLLSFPWLSVLTRHRPPPQPSNSFLATAASSAPPKALTRPHSAPSWPRWR